MIEKIEAVRFESPYGELVVGSYGNKLCLCDWANNLRGAGVWQRLERLLHARIVISEEVSPVVAKAIKELTEYFAGERKKFTVPLLFEGTDFQKLVWQQLMKVPYGKTVTYRMIARSAGRPSAMRSAANAMALNALSIFVPCHRVIGSDKSLTGYNGGLNTKRELLRLEEAKNTL